MRLQVQSLASLSGLGIWHCRELWCRLQTWLGSGVAVAGSCSSNLTPGLGTSMCHGRGPKKKKKKSTKVTMSSVLKNFNGPPGLLLSHLDMQILEDLKRVNLPVPNLPPSVEMSFSRGMWHFSLFPNPEWVWEERPWRHDNFLQI